MTDWLEVRASFADTKCSVNKHTELFILSNMELEKAELKDFISKSGFSYEEIAYGEEFSSIRCQCKTCENESSVSLRINRKEYGAGKCGTAIQLMIEESCSTSPSACSRKYSELVQREPLLMLFLNYRILMRDVKKVGDYCTKLESQLKEQSEEAAEKEIKYQKLTEKFEKIESQNKELKTKLEEQIKESELKDKSIDKWNERADTNSSQDVEPKFQFQVPEPVVNRSDPCESGIGDSEVSRKRKIDHLLGEYSEEPECKREVLDETMDSLAEELIDQKKSLAILREEKSEITRRIECGIRNSMAMRNRIMNYCLSIANVL